MCHIVNLELLLFTMCLTLDLAEHLWRHGLSALFINIRLHNVQMFADKFHLARAAQNHIEFSWFHMKQSVLMS